MLTWQPWSSEIFDFDPGWVCGVQRSLTLILAGSVSSLLLNLPLQQGGVFEWVSKHRRHTQWPFWKVPRMRCSRPWWEKGIKWALLC